MTSMGYDCAHELRQNLLQPGSPVLAAGAASAIAARVAMDAGFHALWVSGLEVSASLGLPDTNVLGTRDLMDVIIAVRRAAPLPVIVDVDNAGASTDGARRFASDLATAGAAAVCIEDSAFPKCNSFRLDRTQGLASVELMSDQLQQMRRAAGDDLVLIARTEALIAGHDIAAAFARAGGYVDAGADAILIHTRDATGEQARSIGSSWDRPAPLVIVPTSFPQIHWKDLSDWGYRLAIYANQLTRASLAAMRASADEFARTGLFEAAPQARLSTVADLIQLAEPSALATI